LLKGYKLFPVPENPDLRAELEQQTDEQLTALLASFKALHNHTDTCERPRLLRAIEIEVYYREHPELQEACQAVPSVIFGLRGDRDLIRSRITRRLKERLEHGMVDEVRALIDKGVNPNQLIRYGLEYKFLTLYVQGQMDYDTMFKRLNVAIHQFSKRQMTWFRKMERDGFNIHWMDVEWSEEEKLSFVLRTCNLQ
ncbi:MAG: tRNA (adenosine(37)-N6)-dimethylallyltransferase MiaA, partial [Bacteroidales bacterium]|nr:tRNA (adenosine(37)-N6)-dimethylallyltransferase MiaA [Bacteroidales bacterium]